MHASDLLPPPSLKQLGGFDIDELAKASGWRRRSDGRIDPETWIQALLVCPLDHRAALRLMAFAIFASSGKNVSKQAVDNRLESGRKLAEAVLLELLSRQLASDPLRRVGPFRRVLVQDSTSISLPHCQGTLFPYRSDPLSTTATLRVQAVYDLVTASAVNFQLLPDIEKDRKRSVDIAALTRPGDLVLRDLGYFNDKAFARIAQSGACFLSRLHGQSVVCDLEGKPIDLLEKLKGRESLDQRVLLGGEQFERQTGRTRLALRLLATRVPPQVAQERRRKLRSANANVSKRTLAQQDWSIYITNARDDGLDVDTADKLYRQRWSIEIVFKAWKSGLGIDRVPPRASEAFIMNLVLGALLRAVVLENFVRPLARRSSSAKASSYKLATLYPLIDIALRSEVLDLGTMLANLGKYAFYEKRSRPSLPDKLEELIL